MISLPGPILAMPSALELLAMEAVLALGAKVLVKTLPASKVQGLEAGRLEAVPTGPKLPLAELASRRTLKPFLCLCPRRLCPTEILFLGPGG